MRELSLFTGSGGGVLGTTLLGWEHIGYVEWDKYCQRVIRQRIIDGSLDEAPIFSDIRAFIRDGYAASYTGMVDVVSAGFPCQPFSLAGKRRGHADGRNMWPATIECIRIIRPRFALLENVPGLLAHEYARRIFGDLAESGYDVRWRVLSAAELGAPHKRDRLWIVAKSQGGESGQQAEREGRKDSCGGSEKVVDVSHAESGRFTELRSTQGTAGHTDGICEVVANACGTGLSEPTCGRIGRIQKATGAPAGCEFGRGDAAHGAYWATEPDVGRVAHGVASRVDRLKAIGNGQVPAVVRAAWEILSF